MKGKICCVFTEPRNKMQYCCPNCGGTHECRDVGLKRKCQTCRTVYNFQCLGCKAQFKSQARTRTHCFANGGCSSKPLLSCNDCNYKAFYKHNLKAHIQVTHMNVGPKSRKSVKCSKCRGVFKNERSLISHQKHYCGRRPDIICEFCTTMMYRAPYLRPHIVKVHMKQARKEAGS